jgi:hypothetical protein
VNKEMIGKKVSFFGNGWSTHTVITAKYCLLLDQNQDMKDAANSYVNPLTSCGMEFYTQKYAHKKAVI